MNQLIRGGPYLVVKRKQQVDMFKNNGWKQYLKKWTYTKNAGWKENSQYWDITMKQW